MYFGENVCKKKLIDVDFSSEVVADSRLSEPCTKSSGTSANQPNEACTLFDDNNFVGRFW